MTRDEKTAVRWIVSDEAGVSSITIWCVVMGVKCRNPSIPWDVGDFGRCARLLASIPSWRARLPEVAKTHNDWIPLVKNWDRLTEMYDKVGKYGSKKFNLSRWKRMTDYMESLRRETRDV